MYWQLLELIKMKMSKSKNKVLTNTLLVTVPLIIILISHLVMNFNQSNNFYKIKIIYPGKYQEAIQLLEKIQPSDKFETQPLIEKG